MLNPTEREPTAAPDAAAVASTPAESIARMQDLAYRRELQRVWGWERLPGAAPDNSGLPTEG
jgi:hypothetical protein